MDEIHTSTGQILCASSRGVRGSWGTHPHVGSVGMGFTHPQLPLWFCAQVSHWAELVWGFFFARVWSPQVCLCLPAPLPQKHHPQERLFPSSPPAFPSQTSPALRAAARLLAACSKLCHHCPTFLQMIGDTEPQNLQNQH